MGLLSLRGLRHTDSLLDGEQPPLAVISLLGNSVHQTSAPNPPLKFTMWAHLLYLFWGYVFARVIVMAGWKRYVFFDHVSVPVMMSWERYHVSGCLYCSVHVSICPSWRPQSTLRYMPNFWPECSVRLKEELSSLRVEVSGTMEIPFLWKWSVKNDKKYPQMKWLLILEVKGQISFSVSP